MKLYKSFIANIFGNTLEWYDFVLYGSLTPYIAAHFFPNKSFFISLMITFGAFAAGFLMRPLGGLIYGAIGDRYGRRKSLLYSVILMVIPTTLIGLLPSTQQIGVTAAVIVIVLRLLQGLAMGGELVGSMIYLREIAPSPDVRGFYSSFSIFGIFFGILFGPIVILICTSVMPTQAFDAWGWRIPFLLSFIFGLVIFYMRRSLDESIEFIQHAKKIKQTPNPFLRCLLYHKKELLQGIGISTQVGISFWMSMVYMITYLTKIFQYPLRDVEMLNFFGIAAALIIVPLVGKLLKYVNARSILITTSLLFILATLPIYLIYAHGVSLSVIFILHLFLCILVGSYMAAVPMQLSALFPTEIRYTGVAIAYNLALTLFGGTAPMVVTYLIEQQKLLYGVGIVITVGATISLIAALSLNKKYVH